jgi:uncharacterized protein with GYD domain
MAQYVVLGRFTLQGAETIEDSPQRVDAARKLLKSHGATLKAFYLLFGVHDWLAIIDAKDDQKLAAALLAIAAQGNSTTETMRAFDEDEYRKIVKNVG